MQIHTMAWRNLWRNWKRTVITLAAVIMAVLLSTIMSSMQEGTYVKMIDNVVKFYSGYIQVFKPGYWETRSIDDMYEPDKKLLHTLDSLPQIVNYTPRLESFTLLSNADDTRGSALIGIDPVNEDKITHLSRWVKNGKYLSTNDDGILLATNLAKNLKINVGDTLVLISQGYHGESAAALFPVRGILEFPSPQLNNLAAYITLSKAREFYTAPNLITSMVVMVDEYRDVTKTRNLLIHSLGKNYNIMDWGEMQPELVQMIDGDRAGGIVMKIVLYLVIGFGILGTIIMMMAERRREIGITIAVGMQKHIMAGMLFFETLYIGLLGVLSGFILSIPIISYFKHHPIPLTGEMADVYQQFGIEPVLYFTIAPKIFTEQVIIVFVLTMIVALYPVFKTFRLKLINAIHA
jgi:putative ABC transport system permease protein